jgi:SAM-dependent methyltransferase
MAHFEPGILSFQCNICGSACKFPLDQLSRETVSCATCHSTPRTRALVRLCAQELVHDDVPFPELPTRRDLRGLGMSDPENCRSRLASKFAYENTYFHQAPFLDISAEIEPDRLGQYDFVISSEVFEHVVPPVARAFTNVFRLLKPGGLFILTVPYGTQAATIEHFPELHQFTVTQVQDKYILTNVTRAGKTERFDELVFHGGPGATLEMRVFAEADLERQLAAAGFTEITIHRQPYFRYGIWWPQPWSWPISARKALNPSGDSAPEQGSE